MSALFWVWALAAVSVLRLLSTSVLPWVWLSEWVPLLPSLLALRSVLVLA